MRYIALLALVALPLFAGEQPPLERARELFRSTEAEDRNEGTRIVRAELRKVLAPLLRDLDNEDAEVRRRVREALLSVVPHPPKPEPVQNRLRVQFGLGPAQILNVRPMKVQLKDPRVKQAMKLVRRFGILGSTAVRVLPQANVAVPVAGYFVKKAKKDAKKRGLKDGDFILRVNKKRVASELDVLQALDANGIEGAVFTVLRGKEEVVLKPK